MKNIYGQTLEDCYFAGLLDNYLAQSFTNDDEPLNEESATLLPLDEEEV
ncbi:MAG: hypothetical protein FWE37_07175 [Spirochaetaceae bacterium]|nr:hypothetical protein [Spirochaetaceae bacterium]